MTGCKILACCAIKRVEVLHNLITKSYAAILNRLKYTNPTGHGEPVEPCANRNL